MAARLVKLVKVAIQQRQLSLMSKHGAVTWLPGLCQWGSPHAPALHQ